MFDTTTLTRGGLSWIMCPSASMSKYTSATGCSIARAAFSSGTSLKADDLCAVLDSNTAYSKLRTLFYGTDTPDSTPDKDISVDVEDSTQ